MNRPIGFHQIMAPDVEPLDLIRIVAEIGYSSISFFTCSPVRSLPQKNADLSFPTVVNTSAAELISALADQGLEVGGAEFFPITEKPDLEEYERGLALGREIGARRAVTHIFDMEKDRAVERLGTLTDLAGQYDLDVAIEIVPMTPGCTNLEQGMWYVDQVGKSNLGFGIDVLHIVRGGGTVQDVANVEGRYIKYAQINDGQGLHTSSTYFDEVHNRELPGHGDFPLHDMLSAIPAATPIEVEIPNDKRIEQGKSAREFAEEAYRLSRELVDGLTPHR